MENHKRVFIGYLAIIAGTFLLIFILPALVRIFFGLAGVMLIMHGISLVWPSNTIIWRFK